VTPDVEQAIRDAVEPILRSQGLEAVRVIPGLDHDGEPGVDPKVLIQSTPAVRRVLGTEDRMTKTSEPDR
jgi:hypothetical protein